MRSDGQKPPMHFPEHQRYEVGYGKPPASTRFQKGKSGNPKGRRRGSKNKPPALNEECLKSIILEEAYRTIKVNDSNKQVTMSMAEAIIRSVAVTAAKGQTRAQRLFLDMLGDTERSHKQLYDEYLQTMIAYKLSWEEEIEHCKALGIKPPEPIPHPDDIIINLRNGGIRIKGPLTKEEKVKWDRLRARKIDFRASIAQLQQLLREDPDCEYKQLVLDDIAHEQRILHMLEKAIPD